MTDFAGRRVVVVGLGTSGEAAARALLARDAKVYVTDAAAGPDVARRAAALRELGADVEIGGHDLAALHGDLAIASPGIAPHAPVLVELHARGVEIWSEVELAWRIARCSFLAVTGTNGKTTTTSLLAAMLAEGRVPSVAAGNIGRPLVDAVASIPPDGAVAVEVSSFQLAGIIGFRPSVAVLLNIAEDHTDWHGSVEAYAAAKARITLNQRIDDVLVYNEDDPRCRAVADSSAARLVPFSATARNAVGLCADERSLIAGGIPFAARDDLALAGRAGLEDALAAAGAALHYGVDPKAVARALKSFRPLAHRLQEIARRGGISYIDDSKATNPHATLAAVRGLDDVVLIAGGRAKGIDLRPLRDTVPPVRAVVAIGEAAPEIRRILRDLIPVESASSMTDAVARATALARPGGSVLLSPACASLDMYEGYAARGEDFARCVRMQMRGGDGDQD